MVTVSVLTLRNVSCDLTKKVHKAQRPMDVVEKNFVFPFSPVCFITVVFFFPP